MDIREFSALLATYGSRLDKWPHAHRQAATRLLAAAPDAQSMLEEARALDDLLRGRERPVAEERLQAVEDSIFARLDLDDEAPETTPISAPKAAPPHLKARPNTGSKAKAWQKPGGRAQAAGPYGHHVFFGGIAGFSASIAVIAALGLWVGAHLGTMAANTGQESLAYYSIDLWLR